MVKNLNIIGDLEKYFTDHELVLVAVNGFQGINSNRLILKRDFIDEMVDLISYNTKCNKKEILKTYSSLLNKTRDLDYMLANCATVRDIKDAKYYSAASYFKSFLDGDIFPEFLKSLSSLYRITYLPKRKDKVNTINGIIEGADKPIIIYSNGYGDVMESISIDTKFIAKDYNNRLFNGNYSYTKSMIKKLDMDNLEKNISRNIENLLRLNNDSLIYLLGSYVPISLNERQFSYYQKLVFNLNERLDRIAKKYNLSFVDTQSIYELGDKRGIYFTRGQNVRLANELLSRMHEDLAVNRIIREKIDGDIESNIKMDAVDRFVDFSLNYNGSIYNRQMQVLNGKIVEESILKKVYEKKGNYENK